MDLKALVDYVRQSCMIDDPNVVEDSNYLLLKDEDIEVIIRIAYSRLKPYKHLLNEEEDSIYPVILQAKREIFTRLALKCANEFDLKGTSGTLFKDQKFKHYMSLVDNISVEWDNYIKEQEANADVSNTDSFNSLAQGDIFLTGKYFTKRNKDFANKPVISLKVDNVYDTYVELSWKLKRINRFSMYNIYINNTNNIIDNYTMEIKGQNVFSTNDIHRDKFRLKDLTPNTLYHIAIIVQEQNGLYGYDELTFVTKEVENNEE